ncbi:MAG: hypothetical protein E6Q97_04735 [Desulfurellales bacterium]|nr:MAG: hypothetical protein E6Q97_04735 [Desulfurellales bacterium]
MAETFVLSDLNEEPAFSAELPTNAVTGHPYFDHMAPLALFNPTGSGKVLRIKEVRIDPVQEQTAGVVQSYGLNIVSAHTVDDGSTVIPAIKLDSNNAALPAQVVCARWPATITTAGASIDSSYAGMQMNVTRALASFWNSPRNKQLLRAPDFDTQRITLQEGRGIGVSVATNIAHGNRKLQVTIVVRVVATGATHLYRFPANNKTRPLFSLLNGSGSGVVLEIISMSYQEIGTDEGPLYAIEPIDGLSADHGKSVSPVAMDSANSIGTVFARRNGLYRMRGSKVGALITTPHYDWRVAVMRGVSSGFGNQNTGMDRFRKQAAQCCDIVIREGEGLAVTRKNASAFGRERITITFSASDGESLWYVSETFKNSSDANLPDGTSVIAYDAATHVRVGSGKIRNGVSIVPVATSSPVYLVADPSGLGGETVCTTAIAPSVG